MRPLSFAAAATYAVLAISPIAAQSIYGVSVNTSSLKGSSGKLIFDITSNLPITNRVDIVNFFTDGTTGLPETQGTLVSGDLVQNTIPAKSTRIKADTFFTELALPFTAFGERISFTINVSETGPIAGRPPDEFAVYLLGKDGHSLAASGRDDEPNMSITINGQRGGQMALGGRPRSTANSAEGSDESTSLRGPSKMPVTFNVLPAWSPDNPALFQNAQTFSGILTEFCNRRCAGETICTGGAFGLSVDENTFYAFDDVSNLKAQVALVDGGRNPLKEGTFGTVKVVGIINNSVLTIQQITLF